MTLLRLVWKNLTYHWRGNLAVALGVAVGTAVLAGALLVGDSVRGSLRALALDRLGWVEQAMVTPRFFREDLAREVSVSKVAPAILLQGNASKGPSGADTDIDSLTPPVRRAGKITILGVDQRFWPAAEVPANLEFWQGDAAKVVLNSALATALRAQAGDQITLHVQKAENIPRETLLGKRQAQQTVKPIVVTVEAVIPDANLGGFTLKPSPEAARNAFLPLKFLQGQLKLPDRANALLIAGASSALENDLRAHLNLADWGLRLRTPRDRAESLVRVLTPRDRPVDGKLRFGNWNGRVPDELARTAVNKTLTVAIIEDFYRRHHGYLSLESDRLFIEPAVAEAVHHLVKKQQNLKEAPTLVYLADTITDGKNEIPYAVVAACPTLAEPPLGPMQAKGTPALGPKDIILTDLPEADGGALSPLKVKPGDDITLLYYLPDARGQLRKDKQTFRVREIRPIEGAADDPFLTPEFPGITDRRDIDEITQADLPFPYDAKRTRRGHVTEYWTRYRTTPRAYVALERGQELWGSRFGKLTSIRLAPIDRNLDRAAIRDGLLAELKPEQGGFAFEDVRQRATKSGAGSADFGMLFLAFSFFLIVAALLLVGLLFRLNLDRRAHEIGLLLATGFRRRTVRRLLLAEGGIVAGLGGLVGLACAGAYAALLIQWLSTRWPGPERLTFLQLDPSPSSFLIGYFASLAIGVLTVFWALRILGKLTPRELLAGETTEAQAPRAHKRRWRLWIAVGAGLAGAGCLTAGLFASGHEAQTASFFSSGALLLVAGLAGVWSALVGGQRHTMATGAAALARLGVRNAGRHAVRSLLTVGLLASATFLVVAVESFHKTPGQEFHAPTGGSGGFRLLAETDVPFFQDLNDPDVQKKLAIPQPAKAALRGAKIFAFRLRPGDDASCLNLYQPLRPRILGVPPELVSRGGFAFTEAKWTTPEDKANPWRLLEQPQPDGAIPVFADANTAEWILKISLEGIIEVPDEEGGKRRLRVVGLLAESIFQSELLMSQGNFQRLYPHQEGFQFFLAECAPESVKAVKSALETALAAQGVSVMPTEKRLEAYLAVENTYLETFQALGGLGLLLGALGLAVVLVRSVWERRGELALLRALGFRRRALGWLLLAENGYLLLLGLAVGTAAALVAVLPHLAGDVLWLRLARLLLLVVAVGFAAGWLAVAATLRAPLIPALRRE